MQFKKNFQWAYPVDPQSSLLPLPNSCDILLIFKCLIGAIAERFRTYKVLVSCISKSHISLFG